jgi:hypothetical protein
MVIFALKPDIFRKFDFRRSKTNNTPVIDIGMGD